MNDWLNFFYFFMGGAALLLSVLGLWFTVTMPGIDRWSKRFFQYFFIVLMACCFSSFMEMILQSFPALSTAYYFVLFLECLFLSLPLPMLTVYLLHCCSETVRDSKLFHIVLGLWAVYLVLLVYDICIDSFIVYVTPDGKYIRGPWYPILILPLVVIMLFNLTGVIQRRKQLSHKTFLSFLIAILPMTVVLFVQMFVDAFALLDISIVLSSLSMYSFILSDQIEQGLCQQREIAEQQQKIAEHQLEIANQRASIMVLQMRPHFIYNTMMSIYALCNQDPQLARQVIMDFTTYLRKNFTAIASAGPIPFSSELDHTRAYLAVEQAQYEDSLFVDYDTPHTWFRVPPLTLQPIVENAVKHGRDPYAGPFRISIRTRKTDTGSEIAVEDNGRGFTFTDDSEPHIALQNIQQRLEIMCRGSLTITSGEGCGTVVTVTIPDNVDE